MVVCIVKYGSWPASMSECDYVMPKVCVLRIFGRVRLSLYSYSESS